MDYRTRIAFHEVDYGRVIFHGSIHAMVQKALDEHYVAAGVDLRQIFRELKVGTPVIESRAVFVSPLMYLDEVVIQTGIVDLTEKGYRMLFNILALPGERLAVAGHLRHRFVDTRSFRGTSAPPQLLEQLQRLKADTPLVDSLKAYKYD